MGRRDDVYIPADGQPRALLDKLGVKPEDRIAVLGVADATFRSDLRARVATPPRTRLAKDLAIIFYAADSVSALERLPQLRAALRQNGAIWVVSRKGKAATVRDTDVIAAAEAAGLVDTKVVAFSPTHTALKLVIPLARRTT